MGSVVHQPLPSLSNLNQNNGACSNLLASQSLMLLAPTNYFHNQMDVGCKRPPRNYLPIQTSPILPQYNPIYSPAHPSLMEAATSQAHIGFFGHMTGRISSLWIPLQAKHYQDSDNSRSAFVWAKRLCQQLIQVSHSLWTARNQQIKSIRLSQELLQLDMDIRSQFDLGTQNLSPSDHFYVTRLSPDHGFDLTSVLGMDISDKRLWLSAIQEARTHYSQPTLT